MSSEVPFIIWELLVDSPECCGGCLCSVLLHSIQRSLSFPPQHFENKSDDEIVAFVCHDGDRHELWPYRPSMKDAEAVFESAVAVRALDYAQEVAALHELMYRRGLDYVIRPNEELSTVRDFFTNLSRRAGLNQIW